LAEKAIRLPSGEKRAPLSAALPAVSLRGFAQPSVGAIQRSALSFFSS